MRLIPGMDGMVMPMVYGHYGYQVGYYCNVHVLLLEVLQAFVGWHGCPKMMMALLWGRLRMEKIKPSYYELKQV
jgi:hypothetical protein